MFPSDEPVEIPLESPHGNHLYTIAIICPLSIEQDAMEVMLDERHGERCQPTAEGDGNTYIVGSLQGHFVVIMGLPQGSYGNITAVSAMQGLMKSFKNIRFGLLVGIGGGIPGPELQNPSPDIRLGDIAVGIPQGRAGGVIKFDQGKKTEDGFIIRGHFEKPRGLLLAATSSLSDNERTLRALDVLMRKKAQKADDLMGIDFKRPSLPTTDGNSQKQVDILYGQKCDSKEHEGLTCFRKSCWTQLEASKQTRVIVERAPRKPTLNGLPDLRPRIHYGTILSGDCVVADADRREEIRKLTETYDTKPICVEMEAAGLTMVNELGVMVIRGINDYCDSQKNDKWKPYAAFSAAAYTSLLLRQIPRQNVNLELETLVPAQKAVENW